jgi:hypothetical protein
MATAITVPLGGRMGPAAADSLAGSIGAGAGCFRRDHNVELRTLPPVIRHPANSAAHLAPCKHALRRGAS